MADFSAATQKKLVYLKCTSCLFSTSQRHTEDIKYRTKTGGLMWQKKMTLNTQICCQI